MSDTAPVYTVYTITDSDADIRAVFRVAADDAAKHRASVCGGCGDTRGRCQHRRSAFVEADGLLDIWLARNGRPV